MTIKEQLKQLLENTPYCENDCYLYRHEYTTDEYKEYLNEIMVNHLLSNNVVVFPCKIGDVVYVIDNRRPCYACAHCTDFCHIHCPFPDRLEKVVKKATVIKILMTQHMDIEILVEIPETDNIFSYALHYSSADFDKTIFLSEEKAKKALGEEE